MVNTQGHSVDTLHDGKMEGPVVSLEGTKTRGNINLTLLLGYDGLVGRVMAILVLILMLMMLSLILALAPQFIQLARR